MSAFDKFEKKKQDGGPLSDEEVAKMKADGRYDKIKQNMTSFNRA